MLTLYGSGRSRWVRPLWMLRELGVPFETATVDRAGGELDSAAFRALNPTGKIPVLVDDGRAIYESGAILLYLADKFPERGLAPPPGSYARGVYYQWMFQTATELEPPIWQLHKSVQKGAGDAAMAERAYRDIATAAAPFEAALAQRNHLLGGAFQAVDIMLTHLLTWVVVQDLLADLPALRDYRDRMVGRPGFPMHLYEDVPFIGSISARSARTKPP